MPTDLLTSQQRDAERDIDSVMLGSPLLRKPRATAMWHMLAHTQWVGLDIMHESFALEHLLERWPVATQGLEEGMTWVSTTCAPGGEFGGIVDEATMFEARRLFNLGVAYKRFRRVYTMASAGEVAFNVEGNTLRVASPSSTAVGAHLLLTRAERQQDIRESNDLIHDIIRSSSIQRNKPTVVNRTALRRRSADLAARGWRMLSALPSDWQFSRYSLRDYALVCAELWAEAGLSHFSWIPFRQVRLETRNPALVHLPRSELVAELTMRCGLPTPKVAAVVEDLTFGSRGLHHPDPVLQPLLLFEGDTIAFSPMVVLHSLIERNVITLFNRIPEEQKIYERLKNYKESLMRARIVDALPKTMRCWHGRVPGVPKTMPDVDLVVIDDGTKHALLMELKWFIEPAEPRELINRLQDLRKGSQQLKDITTSTDYISALMSTVGSDSSYSVSSVVVSANWIGDSHLQGPDDVVFEGQLVGKFARTPDLSQIIAWLRNRAFLPRVERDFEIGPVNVTRLGPWSLYWENTFRLIDPNGFLERSIQ